MNAPSLLEQLAILPLTPPARGQACAPGLVLLSRPHRKLIEQIRLHAGGASPGNQTGMCFQTLATTRPLRLTLTVRLVPHLIRLAQKNMSFLASGTPCTPPSQPSPHLCGKRVLLSHDKTTAPDPAQPARGERAGVGIILALNPDESLYVHTVCPSSSAEHYLFPVSPFSLCPTTRVPAGEHTAERLDALPCPSSVCLPLQPPASGPPFLTPRAWNQGDVLMRIGKEYVYRAPAPYVADLLLGTPGSELEVWVRRQNPNGDPQHTTHCVKMIRRRTDPEMARKSIRNAFEESSGN